MTRGLRPLSERILAHLPGPRLVWIVIWALVPWLNAGANLLLETGARSAIWEQSDALVVLSYAALSLSIVTSPCAWRRRSRRWKDSATFSIPEWPIDEGTFARVLTIATSVIAITVARLILDPLGL